MLYSSDEKSQYLVRNRDYSDKEKSETESDKNNNIPKNKNNLYHKRKD